MVRQCQQQTLALVTINLPPSQLKLVAQLQPAKTGEQRVKVVVNEMVMVCVMVNMKVVVCVCVMVSVNAYGLWVAGEMVHVNYCADVCGGVQVTLKMLYCVRCSGYVCVGGQQENQCQVHRVLEQSVEETEEAKVQQVKVV